MRVMNKKKSHERIFREKKLTFISIRGNLQQQKMAMENVFKNTWKMFYTLIYHMIYCLHVERSEKNNRSKLLKTFSCFI
jgi:hypothetical protein